MHVSIVVDVLPPTPVYPTVMGTQHLLRCKFTGHASHISYRSKWDFGYPHPQAERCGQSSCKFLARLQEFCLYWLTKPAWCTGNLALPGARDCLAAAREFVFAFCVCVSVCLCTVFPQKQAPSPLYMAIKILHTVESC